jgi:hypothetical protein
MNPDPCPDPQHWLDIIQPEKMHAFVVRERYRRWKVVKEKKPLELLLSGYVGA